MIYDSFSQYGNDTFLKELITVGYESSVYTVTEDELTVTLNVTIFDPPSGAPWPFTLSFTTEDGTAGL